MRYRLDPYIAGASPLHRADPRVKLAVAAAYACVVLAVPVARPERLAGAVVLLVCAAIVSGLPVRPILLRATPVAGLIGLAAVGLLFEGSPAQFVSVSAKAFLCAGAALLLTATTPFHSILAALRALRFSPALLSVTGLGQRLVFVILGEALRMADAYRCRAPSAGPVRRAYHVARMTQALCMRAVSRTDRLERALLARGFDGALRGLPLPPLRRSDAIVLAGGLVTLALLGLQAWW